MRGAAKPADNPLRIRPDLLPASGYTREVEAVDPAGNASLAMREISIDRYAPTISLTGLAANAQVKKGPTNITGTLTVDF